MADTSGPYTRTSANTVADNTGTNILTNPDGSAPVGPGPVTVVTPGGGTQSGQTDGTQVSVPPTP
jgi:hypothetical protein